MNTELINRMPTERPVVEFQGEYHGPIVVDDPHGMPVIVQSPVALNVRNLHPSARNRFKAKCAEAGVSMERAARRFFEMVAYGELNLKDLGIGPRTH